MNIPVQIIKKRGYLLLYALLFVCISIYLSRKPAYNWDMLAYMGVILSYGSNNANEIHTRVYSTAKAEVPSPFYERLTDPNNKYRTANRKDPGVFYSQSPFYVVKPLYTYACWLCYKAGASLTRSTVLPSAIAYFLIAVLLFRWLAGYLHPGRAFVIAGLLMLSTPVIKAASLSTPDTVSSLFMLLSFYYLIEKASIKGCFAFSILALFTRPDNIIPAFSLLTVCLFTKRTDWSISLPLFLFFSGIMLFSLLLIAYSAHSFGWNPLYYPTFMKQLNPSWEINNHFTFKGYWQLVRAQFITGLFTSHLWVLFLLIGLLIHGPGNLAFKQLSAEQLLSLLFLAVIAIRFVLQPVVADRFYIPYYLAAAVFVFKRHSFSLAVSHNNK